MSNAFWITMGICFLSLTATTASCWIVWRLLHRSGARRQTPEQWRAIFQAHTALLRQWDGELRETAEALASLATSAPGDLTVALPPGERERARLLWARFHDLALQLDAHAAFHRDFVLWLRRRRWPDHVRAFLLCDAADLIVHEAAWRLSGPMFANARWERLLNDADAALGLPANSFDALHNEVHNPERAARQFLARQYLKTLRLLPAFAEATADENGAWLLARVEELHPRLKEAVRRDGIAFAARQTRELTTDVLYQAWFPMQKNLTNLMGLVRFRSKSLFLITEEQIDQLRAKMQPGDICVSRKNMYLSNAGIPGFWPHTSLHLGTAGELEAFFDDEQVRTWIRTATGKECSFTELLRSEAPRAWEAYATELEVPALVGAPMGSIPETMRRPNAFVEAIAAGVVFRPGVQTFGADNIGVVRPRLSKPALACAIRRAFLHWGKPYDYDFNFLSDAQLVCSELIFKSFQAEDGIDGLHFDLSSKVGRPVLPPNDIARKFDLEWGTESQQFDFVGFLDSREAAGCCVWGTMEDFRHSWERPKWGVLMSALS
ncbi:MAG: hypothetical protein PWP23_1878 [Candidatus Sumerlaeota bacterium]|nr:hypothetical protein [Candidatus Sumerlaeota bacterium]